MIRLAKNDEIIEGRLWVVFSIPLRNGRRFGLVFFDHRRRWFLGSYQDESLTAGPEEDEKSQ